LAQIADLANYRQQSAPLAASPVERLLADARLRLVETGTRNRLVHTPRGAKRTRSVVIVNAFADALFEAIACSDRTMRLMPTDTASPLAPDASADNVVHLPDPVSAMSALQTNLADTALEKRLLTIYRDAKTAEEEQGINILYLAIGFLRWYEDDNSDVVREAPLVLVPVSLVRDPRRSTFTLRARDEDITTNQAIQERLSADFGVTLPDIPEDEEWCPSDYFAAVQEAVQAKLRWSTDPDAVELGFYSFSKQLMIRDLDPAAWANDAILEHPLLRALLLEGFSEQAAPLDDETVLDTRFAPADFIQVVDADSSQTIVIETVRAGGNLVVQGPPGTGKSQTVTNIIASAVHDGKSVLFVAEKMAALDVVHARLRRVGLGPICLELHSRSVNKRLVLAELETTLDQSVAEPDAQAEIARLMELRGTLNAVDQRMHAPVHETGVTPFHALSRLILAAESDVVSHSALLAEAGRWSATDYASITEGCRHLSELTTTAGTCVDHPYYGVQATHLQPGQLARLAMSLTALAQAAGALAERADDIVGRLGIRREATLESVAMLLCVLQTIGKLPPDAAEIGAAVAGQEPSRILEAARSGLAWSDLKNTHAETFTDVAWDTPAASLRPSLASGLSFFGRFGRGYRQTSKLLAALVKMPVPKKAQARIELVDRLIAVQKAREELAGPDAPMSAMIPTVWRGEKSDFAALHSAASIVQMLASSEPQLCLSGAIELAQQGLAHDHIAEITRAVEELVRTADAVLPVLEVDFAKAFQVDKRDRIPLRSLAAKACHWRDAHSRFDEWRRLAAADAGLRALSATTLADALATGAVPADAANAVLDCTRAEVVWSQAVAATPALLEFYGPQHDAIAEEFRGLEAKRRRTTVDIVRGRHAATMPRGNFGAMNAIRSEIKRKRGHMPIRKLFKTAGETLQRIKPVLLMSPISVAQFVPPGSVEFDLLVIDEASQVRPEDALGLVARAKQIVVVGDNKQLPPTSFFDRILTDGDGSDDTDEDVESALQGAAKATEIESILALCEARGLNTVMLRWHYRSRHPSLIVVSNAEFYRRLIMPPAPSTGRANEGLVLRRVAGAYDRGGKRTNIIEAEAVAAAVADHAKTNPLQSLGVVTFSSAQRDAITDLLEFKRRTNDSLDAFLREGKVEDVFVKNLENVQGDERDVILVSVAYGPRSAGGRLDSMGFGPVSAEGGERRLNVLFTRARSRCEIFASFAAGDIDLDRAKGEGARVLKRFLQYAETGVLEEHVSTSDDADSPFEEVVATVVEGLGYKVDKQVGSAGFRIDLAVRHPDQPGRYVLAIECDGATYHSALWARERDRLRQEILENLGWRFHRIWSTDWFYRRGEVVQKLNAALEAAAAAVVALRPDSDAGSASGLASVHPAPIPPSHGPQIPAYRLAEVATPRGVEPHRIAVSDMANITNAIVEIEGPVHQDEVARRVTALFGKARTGSLISAASLRSLTRLKSSSKLIEQDGFWMTPDQHKIPPVRDRSAAPIALQRANMVAPIEIRAAIKLAIQENGSLGEDEMAIAVTGLLGFRRTGPELKAAIAKAVSG
jgi:very-short-patch-repair endonuclease